MNDRCRRLVEASSGSTIQDQPGVPNSARLARWSDVLIDLPAHVQQLTRALTRGDVGRSDVLMKLSLGGLGQLGKGLGKTRMADLIARAMREI